MIRSWLLELTQNIFKSEPDLRSIAPYIVDSGEGQWTIQAAMEEAVPVPVMAAALFALRLPRPRKLRRPLHRRVAQPVWRACDQESRGDEDRVNR